MKCSCAPDTPWTIAGCWSQVFQSKKEDKFCDDKLNVTAYSDGWNFWMWIAAKYEKIRQPRGWSSTGMLKVYTINLRETFGLLRWTMYDNSVKHWDIHRFWALQGWISMTLSSADSESWLFKHLNSVLSSSCISFSSWYTYTIGDIDPIRPPNTFCETFLACQFITSFTASRFTAAPPRQHWQSFSWETSMRLWEDWRQVKFASCVALSASDDATIMNSNSRDSSLLLIVV